MVHRKERHARVRNQIGDDAGILAASAAKVRADQTGAAVADQLARFAISAIQGRVDNVLHATDGISL
jgi:hypothetical protein